MSFDFRDFLALPNDVSGAAIQKVGPGGGFSGVGENVKVLAAGEMADGEKMRAFRILPATAAVREGKPPHCFLVGISRLHPKIPISAAPGCEHARFAVVQQITND